MIRLTYPFLLWGIPISAVFFLLTSFLTFIRFSSATERKEYFIKQRFLRIMLFLSRTILFSFLILALAFPYDTQEQIIQQEPRVTILVDDSKSMDVLDATAAEKLQDQLSQQFPTQTIHFSPGEESRIGDALLSKSRGGQNVILASDGQTTSGKDLSDVLLFMATQNTTVNALDLPARKGDRSVSLAGPAVAIVGSETVFDLLITTSGEVAAGSVAVSVENTAILNNAPAETKSFAYTFPKPGYYRIVAKISGGDYFSQNDIAYKAVQVVEKPKVLYITNKPTSPLYQSYSSVYALTKTPVLPPNLYDYPVVVIDDMPAETVGPWTDKLSQYLLDGNGLVVVGGQQAYDRSTYEDSLFETILPVTIGEAAGGGGSDVNLVILIDISESAGQSFDAQGNTVSKFAVEKGIALKILEGLYGKDNVALIAFNSRGYVVNNLAPLEQQQDIKDKIYALNDGLATNVKSGLTIARHMLDSVRGSKNVIILSDGIDSDPKNALRLVQNMHKEGITIYSVGVGFDTDRTFMQTMAKLGGGIYFEPDKTQYLNVLFGPPPKGEDTISKGSNLYVVDHDHFITKNLDVSGRVSGINFVIPKDAAQLLVTSNEGYPVLTTWRYGLGRVASIATDSGNAWSGGILVPENQRFWTRTLNWAIGDLSKDVDHFILAKDTSLGRTMEILVKSPTPPKDPALSFSTLEGNWYKAEYTPKQSGFFTFLDGLAAVNYPAEYERMGLNPDLADLVRLTGGELFKPDDIDHIADTIFKQSRVTQTALINYRWIFIGAALLVFFIELIFRRFQEGVMSRGGR